MSGTGMKAATVGWALGALLCVAGIIVSRRHGEREIAEVTL